LNLTKQPTAIICLSPYDGGMEIDSIKLAKKLSKYMQILLIAKQNAFIEKQRDTYVDFNNIKLETIKFKSNFSLSIIVNARKIIKHYNIKNVIFFGASELKSLYFSFLGLNINLMVRHGTTKSTPKKDFFHKLIYSNVNYHISICKHLENNVKYIIPFAKHTQSKLIYSSFDFQQPKHIKHTRLTLLHVGRIANAKGQVDAIKACEILHQNHIDFELNLVGGFDKKYQDEFMEFYNKSNYKHNINLIGFTNEVITYIQKADIFIFPSWGEGLSNAFLEAINNNLVCLSYNNTSFPELRELGLYFKLVEDKNIDKLKIELLNVATNLSLEQDLSSDNFNKVQQLFSLKNEINKYMEILK